MMLVTDPVTSGLKSHFGFEDNQIKLYILTSEKSIDDRMMELDKNSNNLIIYYSIFD